MSDKLDQVLKRLDALAEEVNSTKHLVRALTESLQIADTALAIAIALKAREVEERERAAAEERRRSYILRLLAWGDKPPPGQQRRTWLAQQLEGTPHGPLRELDIAEFRLNGPPTGEGDEPDNDDAADWPEY